MDAPARVGDPGQQEEAGLVSSQHPSPVTALSLILFLLKTIHKSLSEYLVNREFSTHVTQWVSYVHSGSKMMLTLE